MHAPEQSPLGPLADAVFDAVIFDMDGTLVDSTAAVVRAWTLWAERYELTEDDLAHSHGIPSSSIVRRLIPTELQSEALEYIDDLEVNDVEGVIPLPGAVEALAALTDDRCAIATSCERELFEARMAASALPHPRVCITADQVTNGKPDPEPFLLAAERLGHDPRRCLVVEDAVSGLTGAKAAGCATLAVVSTTPRETLLDSGQADAIVDNLATVRFIQDPNGIRLALR